MVENNSAKDYTIGCDALIVNDYMITDLFSADVAAGKNFDEVFERAMFFEMACRIIVQSGGKYTTLTPEEIDDLEVYVLGKKQ